MEDFFWRFVSHTDEKQGMPVSSQLVWHHLIQVERKQRVGKGGDDHGDHSLRVGNVEVRVESSLVHDKGDVRKRHVEVQLRKNREEGSQRR
jgi:hypothetical protein